MAASNARISARWRAAGRSCSFIPKDFTFVCPTEIRAYEAFAPRFREADAALLGASVDSVQVHRAWVEHAVGSAAEVVR